MTLSFDPIGTMGINQQFTANAVVKDALTGQPLTGNQAPVPVYSVTGPASVNGSQLPAELLLAQS